ncbi:hypothetical protein cyc_04390 [Cyclospora cayetanensis]|uniref:Uncharacterized protein n=1 Tax=Cyclospora cayetanensis TaxID=88456 RepID=A0A1D3CSJ5_9EIME|nr:hypothetical protein cyc_04390 [Cyclospora cayetanensis]
MAAEASASALGVPDDSTQTPVASASVGDAGASSPVAGGGGSNNAVAASSPSPSAASAAAGGCGGPTGASLTAFAAAPRGLGGSRSIPTRHAVSRQSSAACRVAAGSRTKSSRLSAALSASGEQPKEAPDTHADAAETPRGRQYSSIALGTSSEASPPGRTGRGTRHTRGGLEASVAASPAVLAEDAVLSGSSSSFTKAVRRVAGHPASAAGAACAATPQAAPLAAAAEDSAAAVDFRGLRRSLRQALLATSGKAQSPSNGGSCVPTGGEGPMGGSSSSIVAGCGSAGAASGVTAGAYGVKQQGDSEKGILVCPSWFEAAVPVALEGIPRHSTLRPSSPSRAAAFSSRQAKWEEEDTREAAELAAATAGTPWPKGSTSSSFGGYGAATRNGGVVPLCCYCGLPLRPPAVGVRGGAESGCPLVAAAAAAASLGFDCNTQWCRCCTRVYGDLRLQHQRDAAGLPFAAFSFPKAPLRYILLPAEGAGVKPSLVGGRVATNPSSPLAAEKGGATPAQETTAAVSAEGAAGGGRPVGTRASVCKGVPPSDMTLAAESKAEVSLIGANTASKRGLAAPELTDAAATPPPVDSKSQFSPNKLQGGAQTPSGAPEAAAASRSLSTSFAVPMRTVVVPRVYLESTSNCYVATAFDSSRRQLLQKRFCCSILGEQRAHALSCQWLRWVHRNIASQLHEGRLSRGQQYSTLGMPTGAAATAVQGSCADSEAATTAAVSPGRKTDGGGPCSHRRGSQRGDGAPDIQPQQEQLRVDRTYKRRRRCGDFREGSDTEEAPVHSGRCATDACGLETVARA